MQSDRNHSMLKNIVASMEPDILIEAKKKVKETGQIMRVFDDFPCLLDQETMAKFQAIFLRILDATAPSSIRKDDNGIELTDKEIKQLIYQFIKTIIHAAQVELLDRRNGIKQEVAKFLQWEEKLTETKVNHVICAYVGKVVQDIMKGIDQDVLNEKDHLLSDVLGGVLHYITQHYKEWVEQELNSYLKISPAAAGLMTAGFLLFGAGVTMYCTKESHMKSPSPPFPS